jgi:hypothetical protein
MAQSGYTPLSLYYSATAATAPLAANLVAGELALNTNDGKLYYKDSSGVVQVLASKAGSVNVSSFSGGTTGLTPNTATTGAVTLAGTLGATNGGTAQTTYTTGDTLYASASNTLSKLAIGTNGQILRVVSGVPAWGTDYVGTVTSVSGTGTVNGLTLTGMVTSSGSLTLGGTLDLSSPPAIGGTTAAAGSFTNLAYTGTLTGGTGVVNLGSGQFYKDASGNVGIGTSSPNGPLDVNATTPRVVMSISGTAKGQINIAGSAMNLTANDATYPMTFNTGGGERMRIDSSGNVGIGTSSPVTKLQVQKSGKSFQLYDASTNDGAYMVFAGSNTTKNWCIGNQFNVGGGLEFTQTSASAGTTIGSTPAMVLDSSGNLLVGQTTNPVPARIAVGYNGTTTDGIVINDANSASGSVFQAFTIGGTFIGQINRVAATSAVAYVTTSDYRLKENIAPMTGALATVQKLKPVTYDWISGGSSQGFIAHELAEVCSDAVQGEKDAVNKDGSIKPQGIDTSFLVATLTAAIQEQQALIENLTTRLTALESK